MRTSISRLIRSGCSGLLALLTFLSVGAHAQTISTGGGSSNDGFFLYEVKMIDEFIERFNDDTNSNLRRVYSEHKHPVNFTRVQLLSALFEPPDIVRNPNIARFIAKMTDSLNPFYLSFHDTGWYAEVNCHFTLDKRPCSFPLILQLLNHKGEKGYKWMITGIGRSPALDEATVAGAALDTSRLKGSIPAANNGLNFMALHRVLQPGLKAPQNYFTPELLATDRGRKFVQLVSGGKLAFESTGDTKFHFFQIPDYVMVVERFIRNTNHSGWLISNLSNAGVAEKNAQKEKLLQRAL